VYVEDIEADLPVPSCWCEVNHGDVLVVDRGGGKALSCARVRRRKGGERECAAARKRRGIRVPGGVREIK
jgi:hypothetical protein